MLQTQIINVVHLYELDGSGTRYGRTVGYFADRTVAEAHATKLGHVFFEIEEGLPAVRLDDGSVFLLRQREPIILESSAGD